ncbi:hypothetical protein AX17_004980 [Amanita inopinata Kibby_2008]|nr:hypothetical protein AX17_004980 [Amanita inopinata Kibby_2008]
MPIPHEFAVNPTPHHRHSNSGDSSSGRKRSALSLDTMLGVNGASGETTNGHHYANVSQIKRNSAIGLVNPSTPPPSLSSSSALWTKRQSAPINDQNDSKIITIPDLSSSAYSPSYSSSTPLATPFTPTPTASASTPTPPSFSSSSPSSPSLISTRPAPPSPAISRRASGINNSSSPSLGIVIGRSSRPTSGMAGLDGASGSPNPLKRLSSSSGTGAKQEFSPLPSPKLATAMSMFGGVGAGFTPARATSATGDAKTHQQNAISLNDEDHPLPSGKVPSAVSSTVAERKSPSSKASKTFIKIRDFAFATTDERHHGLGPFVPKTNRVATLNRKLAMAVTGGGSSSPIRGRKKKGLNGWSDSDSEGLNGSSDSGEEWQDEVEDEDDDGGRLGMRGSVGGFEGWSGFRFGRLSWHVAAGMASDAGAEVAGHQGFPSRTDLERNFLDDNGQDDDILEDSIHYADQLRNQEGDDDDYANENEDVGNDEMEMEDEPLYPGLYRALYAFEPEGIAEMGLEEDQVVRVVGRGGGVGWAVVVDVREGREGGHALVPESYLEVIKLDAEEE